MKKTEMARPGCTLARASITPLSARLDHTPTGRLGQRSDFDARALRLPPIYPPATRRAAITSRRSGLYELNEAGCAAVIVAMVDSDGLVIDHLAYAEEKPEEWWLQRRIGVLLGEAEIDRAHYLGLPLLLHATPAAWVRSTYQPSACIIDWGAPSLIADALIGIEIHAAPAIARRLRAAMARLSPALNVIEIGRRRRAA